jgi:hypothetical protein
MPNAPKKPLDYFPREAGTDSPAPRHGTLDPATEPVDSEPEGGYDAMIQSLARNLARRNAQARKDDGSRKERSKKALSRVLAKIMDQDT